MKVTVVFAMISAKCLLLLLLLLLLLNSVLQRGHVNALDGEVDVERNVRSSGGDHEVEGRPEHGRWRPLQRLQGGRVRQRRLRCVRHYRLYRRDKEENARTTGEKIAIRSQSQAASCKPTRPSTGWRTCGAVAPVLVQNPDARHN